MKIQILSLLCYTCVHIISRDCQKMRDCYKMTLQLLLPEAPLIDSPKLDENCDGDLDPLAKQLYTESIEDSNTTVALEAEIHFLYQRTISLTQDNITDSAEYLLRQGSIFLQIADYINALLFFDKYQEVIETKFGYWHLNTAIATDYQGRLLERVGHTEFAKQRYEKSLKIKSYLLGKRHPGLANAYKNLGRIFFTKGESKPALFNMKQALEIYGKDNRCSASIYNHMGILYQEENDFVKALECYQKSMKIREAHFGSHNPEMASSYFNLAQLYHRTEDYEKFLMLYEKYLNAKILVLEEGDLEIPVLYNNIATHYHHLLDFKNALKYYRKAAGFFNSDVYHPQNGIVHNNMALLYHEMGYHAQALEYSATALKINLFNFGEIDQVTAASYFFLGLANEGMSDYDNAIKYYLKTLKIVYWTNGKDSFCNAFLHSHVANIYVQQRNYSAALFNLKTAKELSLADSSSANECTAVQMNKIAQVFLKQGKYEDAYLILAEARNIAFPSGNLEEQMIIQMQTEELLNIVSEKIDL